MVWLGWGLIGISAAILAYNWGCVFSYWRTGRAPGFAHFFGGIPAAVAIGLGWIGAPRWLAWLPILIDPGGGLYALGFLRFLLTKRR